MMGKRSRPQVEIDEAGRITSVPVGDPAEALHRAYGGECANASMRIDSPVSSAPEGELGRQLDHLGYHRDATGAVRLPPPMPEEAFRDEGLFALDDDMLVRLVGIRKAMQLLTESRFQRAGILADHGRLTKREVDHLRWLATAERPREAVREGTEPLTQVQAQELVERLERHAQTGRTERSPMEYFAPIGETG